MLSWLNPGTFTAWRERRRAMQDLRKFAEQEQWSLALSNTNHVNLAKIALSLNDQKDALFHWQEAMARYPDFAKKHRDSLGILVGLKLFDEGEKLMMEGMRKFSNDQFYFGGYAEIAEERGDLEEAIKRWQAVMKKFPGWWMGHTHCAICLRRMGELAKSDAILSRAVEMVPNSVPTWIEWGRSAEARKDWEESIRRWAAFREKFQNGIGDVGVAHALEELGRFDEAEARLREARVRTPLSVEIYIGLARLVQRRGDEVETEYWWERTQRQFPLLPFGYEGKIRLFRQQQRYADAEVVALEAIDRFPSEPWPTIEYALLANERKDWQQAVERWAVVRSAWPGRAEAYTRAAEALAALGREDEAAGLRASLTARLG